MVVAEVSVAVIVAVSVVEVAAVLVTLRMYFSSMKPTEGFKERKEGRQRARKYAIDEAFIFPSTPSVLGRSQAAVLSVE